MTLHKLICLGLLTWLCVFMIMSIKDAKVQGPSLTEQSDAFRSSCANMGGLTIPTRIEDDEILLLCLEATVFLDSQRIGGDQ
jgi:hypothetical protein